MKTLIALGVTALAALLMPGCAAPEKEWAAADARKDDEYVTGSRIKRTQTGAVVITREEIERSQTAGSVPLAIGVVPRE
jgi:hypothetical protein